MTSAGSTFVTYWESVGSIFDSYSKVFATFGWVFYQRCYAIKCIPNKLAGIATIDEIYPNLHGIVFGKYSVADPLNSSVA